MSKEYRNIDWDVVIWVVSISFVLSLLIVGGYITGTMVSKAAYDREQKSIAECLNKDMQWIDGNCVSR